MAVSMLAAGFALAAQPLLAGTINGDTTQGWSRVSNLPASFDTLAVASLNGAMYTIGGYNGSNITNVYCYDGTNWSEVAGLPSAHENLAADTFSNAIYAVGDGNTNVWKFDGTNWTLAPKLPYYADSPGIGVLNGELYVVSGGFQASTTNVCKFNGTTWTSVAPFPVNRMRMACGVLNGKLYAIGGDSGSGSGTTNVYVFNGTSWSPGPALPIGTRSHGVGVLNGVLYAVGGQISGSISTNVFMFDGTNWTSGTKLPSGIRAMGMAVFNGALYSVAGDNSSGIISSTVLRYDDHSTHGVVPSSGSHTGGYTVIISGTNLCNGLLEDVTNVTLCGAAVASIASVAGSTQIVVTAGVGTPGQGDVRVYSATEGESFKANGFTYIGPNITVLGTNGMAIANGEAASAAKGTDFGSLSWASALTNTLAITNSGNTNLTISGVTTNGAGASAFSVQWSAASINAGSASNFTIRFAPSAAGSYTAAVAIANDSITTPYIIYLAGTGSKRDQAALTFNPTSPQTYNTTNALSVGGGSGTGAVSFAVAGGPGQIVGTASLKITSGAGMVTVVVTKAADALYNAIAATGTVACAKADQSLTFPAIPNQIVTNRLTLSATAGSGLDVTFAVGSGPVTINANVATFGATGRVSIIASQPGDTNWNAAASVTNAFDVVSAPMGEGSLTAVILPAEVVAAGAQWRVDGGVWRVSGTIVTGLTAGAHTVNYCVVPGYTNPADQSVTISPNQLTAILGTYRLISGDTSYRPVSADFDGDNLADPAIYCPADGLWLERFSNIGYSWGRMTRSFGQAAYAQVAADFDGDQLADAAVYNTTNGEWRAMLSSADYAEFFVASFLGGVGSTAMAADFDGDRLADPTIYNPATGDWNARLSSGGYLTFTAANLLGRTGFAAAAGDLDGDNLADPFVCDMATGQCMMLLSSLGYRRMQTAAGFLGAPQWLLTLADYDGDGKADPAAYNPADGTLAMRLSGLNYRLVIKPEFLKP